MEILENKLIYNVSQKDFYHARETAEIMVRRIGARLDQQIYFKNYLMALSGIFYWNSAVEIRDEYQKKYHLHMRNRFLYRLSKEKNFDEMVHLFYEIIAYYSAEYDEVIQTCDDPVIKEILLFVYHNIEKQVTLNYLSKEFNMSKSYLSLLISKYTNRTLPELLKTFRLKKAARLLIETDQSIEMISSSCGYRSCSYFCHQFKQNYLITPRQFRLKEKNR